MDKTQEEKQMPIKRMFSIYDSKAEAYLTPFFAPTPGVATRMFEAAIMQADHDFRKFAEDYTLFEVGSFNEDTGVFEAKRALQSITTALEIRSRLEALAERQAHNNNNHTR